MKVESQRPDVLTFQQTRRLQDKNTQNVFSEVLREAGRTGFASAVTPGPADSQPLMNARIEQAWNQWYQTERVGPGRYSSTEAPQDLGETFGAILQQAYDEGGYVDPRSFLRGLSDSQLKMVQSVHWLAEPIRVDSLTEEGALNLLIPPAAQVDLNRDGLTQSGAAYGIRFPDSTTPPEVVQAWQEVTADMPFAERMIYELQMKLPVLTANIVLSPDGTYSHTRSPGDPDFVNPMDADDYSFIQVTKDWIEHLDYFRNQMDPLRYQQNRQFWTSFQDHLRSAGGS